MEHLNDVIAQSILDSLGSEDTPVSERASHAHAIIARQAVDIGKLTSQLETLKHQSYESEDDAAHLSQKIRVLRSLLARLSAWETELDATEQTLHAEIKKLGDSLGVKLIGEK